MCELELELGDDECSIDEEKMKICDMMTMILLFDESSMAAALGERKGKLFVSWRILLQQYFLLLCLLQLTSSWSWG